MQYTQLLKYITPHRNILLAVVALLLLSTGLHLLTPLIAGKLTETLLNGPQASGFTVPTILVTWLILVAIRALVSGGSSYLVGSTGAAMSAELRSRVYEHMQILPMTWYQERKQGDILSLLSSDAESISQFVTGTLVQLLPLVLTFIAAFVLMAWLDPLVAGLAALMMPIYYLVMKLLGRRIRPLSSRWIQSRSGMVALVSENLGMIPAIKAFGREPLESARFAEKNTDLLTISKKQILLSSLLSPAVTMLAGGGSLLLLWVGISHVESGKLQPAELVSLLMYVLLLTQPLSSLANVYGQVMHTRGAAERLLAFFAEQPEPLTSGGAPLENVRGHVEFRNMSFAYRGREPVFRGFSLEINPGETIALTGPNGAGKSTLVHLLLRFVAPSEGAIFIDDQDIANADLASLRDQVGLVAQHTLLLNGTVAENIAYGQPLASPEQMKQAAVAARANKFIEALPDGYDTVIGDQGVKLSGGQRQRLSLARSLLKDPPILVFDEATAMFDPEGEKEFIEECHEALSQRTVILITHRPASLALADRIIDLSGA